MRERRKFQQEETERVIIEALLNSDPVNPRQRRLKFEELVNRTDLARATVNRALKRMETEKKIIRVVEAPIGEAVTIYYCPGPDASKVRILEPRRRHYETLAKKFDGSLPARQYLKTVQEALGETFIRHLVESLQRQLPINAEPILREFQRLIMKWVVYHQQPAPENDTESLVRTLRAVEDVKEHPEKYTEELKELQQALPETD